MLDQEIVPSFAMCCLLLPCPALLCAVLPPKFVQSYTADTVWSGSCRALQGDPFGAVFHDRIKMSTGGHRLKIEQKFQLLAPGVMPVKHHSIWQRIEEAN